MEMKVILDEKEWKEQLKAAYNDGYDACRAKQIEDGVIELSDDNIVRNTKDYKEDIDRAYKEGFDKGKAEGRLEGAVGEYSRGFSEGYKQGMETNNFKTPMPIPVPGGWSEPGTNPYPYPNPITCPQVWYSTTMTTTDTAKGFERK